MSYIKHLNSIRNKLSFDIERPVLLNILFEMSRYFDKDFTDICHKYQKNINSNEKKMLRKYFYYGKEKFLIKDIAHFKQYSATAKDKEVVVNDFMVRFEKYGEQKIISSIEERYKELYTTSSKDIEKKWLKYYDNKRKNNSKYSLFVLDYSQENFILDNYNFEKILEIIADMYDSLENYRYFIFKLQGKLLNSNNQDVTWKVLYKIGIYCENFVQFKGEFAPFNRNKQKEVLINFLNSRFQTNEKNRELSDNFYKYISTGLKFEDCLISDTQEHIILTYQKISLDETPIPCPSCMSVIQRGNSYPDMFLRSYECQNPYCTERSKSGRGKRFDDYNTYRYFKLVENKKSNSIDDKLYFEWRKDIFSDESDINKMLLKYYAWNNENVCMTKLPQKKYGRKIFLYQYIGNHKYNTKFNKLPIYRLFKDLVKMIPKKTGTKKISENIFVANQNSTIGISQLLPRQISTVITSPPYYNAREYSQWENLLLYLIDMQINAKTIYDTLNIKGYYFYNIGDIVHPDNVYVASNMSNRRLQLGFFSALIFELCGFNLVGNIIWCKGEVQSKRNSTPNHNTGYVKCINCYEHVLVFKKGLENKIISTVKSITPVIKINSKGENKNGHTAPYPIELVDIITDYVNKRKYVLDPYLGSGTTLKWCQNNNQKGIGYEINETYFHLASNNLNIGSVNLGK